MDETPVYFDASWKTRHKQGCKIIEVRTTGAEKRHITAVLSCTSFGECFTTYDYIQKKATIKKPYYT